MVIRVAPDLADDGFRWSAYADDQRAGAMANRAANRVARRAGAVRIGGGSYLRWQRPELVAT
ncbi:hypothetical protein JQS43_25085 [Natronosporangium hydrolyticum]|uniref:Uncharacterized protein n=1 Tax=Natronosporangium hydrolyticum TaxID=2811111 RepID=A0A895YEX3_9ACTN|nr:hypothetical protein [Natronosporangium hydrolyticum]QSB14692.1 hypothetical protein JQS43_25085 [Natronosporangium hydrolyticum]